MAYKSSRGRDVGKELTYYQDSSIGLGYGGAGGGAGGTVPFSATGGTKTEPGDGYVYHVFDYPNSDDFSVASCDPNGSNIEVVICGGGAGGASRNPGGSTPGAGGLGGAFGVWVVGIKDTGDYGVSVALGGASWPRGTNPFNNQASGSSRFTHTSTPSKYLQAGNGPGAGWNGSPNSYSPTPGPVAQATTNGGWDEAVGAFLASPAPNGYDPNGPFSPFRPGKKPGYADVSPSVWWRSGYFTNGNPIGQNGGNENRPNYGAGGDGTEGGPSPPPSGCGGNGRVVIRYPDSL
tara:strand:+ start:1410 stop:2282 length:873 start_codon:yes stop_codon:yes gene_type:complete